MATITRANYRADYVYFIDTTGKDWRIESLSPNFTVQITSVMDSEATLEAYLANHASLTVEADKAQMVANGVDTVTWSILGQLAFSYRLLKNNLEIASGAVIDGLLTFKTDEPDTYLVELKIGNQTGYSFVEAT